MPYKYTQGRCLQVDMADVWLHERHHPPPPTAHVKATTCHAASARMYQLRTAGGNGPSSHT
jgi:hypothetical protein